MPHIEDWKLSDLAPDAQILTGIVTDHPNARLNGRFVYTSRVVSIDRDAKTAQTLNSTYTLGTELAD